MKPLCASKLWDTLLETQKNPERLNNLNETLNVT